MSADRLILLCALAGACRHAPPPLRLGTTYTVEQSGALAIVDSLWRGAPLAKVIGPSEQILRTASEGDLDLVIVHAPALEAKWLGGGRAALRCPLVASRFAIVGPASDPAGVAGAATAADAMARIAGRRAPFVSRGDSSGTHMKELSLWQAARVSPSGEGWYVESGTSQAATLQIADERGAYALADLPTLARVQGISLRVLFAADTTLLNPYTLYIVRQSPEHPAARAFATWALEIWRDRLAAIRLPDGTAAFTPRAESCAATARP